MKKFFKIFILIVLFFIITGYSIKMLKPEDLSPAHTPELVPEKVYSENLSDICKKTILDISNIKPHNAKIPNEVSIYIKDQVAIVDFNEAPDFSGNFEFEQVFIYSIVNTLTTEKDIFTVEFTVNGDSIPSFGGEIDMSETFIPDYNIISN